MIFQPANSQVARAYPGSSGHKVGSTLNRMPFHCRAAHTLTLRLGQFRHANSPHAHILGIRKETGVPRENPGRHGENEQTPDSGPCQK